MNRFILSICLIIISFQLFANPLDKKYTFQFNAVPIVEVLEIIESATGLNFIFNGDIINENKTVTVEFSDTPLKTIIEYLFNTRDYQYMIHDNQIMLAAVPKTFKAPPAYLKEARSVPQKKEQNIYDTISIIDSVRIEHIDTTFVFDTIVVTDTIVFYDTVSSDNKLPPLKNLSPKKEYIPYIEIGAGIVPSIDNAYKETELSDSVWLQSSSSLKVASADIRIGIQNRFWGIETGLSVYSFRNTYQSVLNEIRTGFNTETVLSDSIITKDSSFYTMPGLDTIWRVVENTEYIYTDQKTAYTYTTTDSATKKNKAIYLAVPVFLSVSPLQTEKHCLKIGGGVVAYILIQQKGEILASTNKPVPEYTSDFARRAFTAYSAFAGYCFSPFRKLGICIEYSYQYSPEYFISSYTNAQKYSQLRFSLRYYLK